MISESGSGGRGHEWNSLEPIPARRVPVDRRAVGGPPPGVGCRLWWLGAELLPLLRRPAQANRFAWSAIAMRFS